MYNFCRNVVLSHMCVLVSNCFCHYLVSCVSRISFRGGGGSKFFWKSGSICIYGAKRHVVRGEATRLLGGFGGMLPRENF